MNNFGAGTLVAPRSIERDLVSLASRVVDLALMNDVNSVLESIVQTAQELLGSDVAYFTMYDPVTDEYAVRTSTGFVSQAFLDDRSDARGQGVYGQIVDRCRPFWTPDYLADDRFTPHPLSVASIRAEGIRALAGAPAVLPGRAMPAVVFVGHRTPRDFSDEEITVLVTLGKLAGALVESARRQQLATDELFRLHVSQDELSVEVARLRRMASVQERLAQVVSHGGTLVDALEVVTSFVAAQAMVCDASGHVLAASDDATACRGADYAAAIQQSFVEHRTVSSGGFLVTALRGQSSLLGALVVEEPEPSGTGPSETGPSETGPSEDVARVLSIAAMHVGSLLLTRERLVTAENRAMADIVTELTRAPVDDLDTVAAHAGRYGVALRDAPLRMAVVGVGRMAHGKVIETMRACMRDTTGLIGLVDGVLVVITSSDRSRTLAARFVAAASSTTDRPVAVLVHGDLEARGLPDAFLRASRSLRLAAALGRRGEVCEEIAFAPYAAAFGGLTAADLDAYLDTFVGPLVARDAAKHSDLVKTLGAYLENGRSARATAAELFVHENTVRQRLAVIESVLPAATDRSKQLEIALALRLHALRRLAAG